MNLYHFTSLPHLEEIIRSGTIQVTESNIGAPWQDPTYPYGSHAGPPVVHLMDVADPFAFDHGLGGAHYDKRQVRFEVNVPGIPWMDWEWTATMSPRWRRILEEQAGQGASDHWHVFPAPIRRRRWASVAVRKDPATPIPWQYREHLGDADEHGYRPLSEALINAISEAPEANPSTPRPLQGPSREPETL